jgi:hypothetical protein
MKATKILSEYKDYFPFINLTNDDQENVKLVLKAFGYDIYKKIYKFAKQDPKLFFTLMSLVAKATIQPDFDPSEDDLNMLLSEFKLREFDLDTVLEISVSRTIRNNLVYSFIAFLELKPNFNSPTITGQYRKIFDGFLEIIQDLQVELGSERLHKISRMIYDYQRLMGYLAEEVLNYKVF